MWLVKSCSWTVLDQPVSQLASSNLCGFCSMPLSVKWFPCMEALLCGRASRLAFKFLPWGPSMMDFELTVLLRPPPPKKSAGPKSCTDTLHCGIRTVINFPAWSQEAMSLLCRCGLKDAMCLIRLCITGLAPWERCCWQAGSLWGLTYVTKGQGKTISLGQLLFLDICVGPNFTSLVKSNFEKGIPGKGTVFWNGLISSYIQPAEIYH